MGGLPLEEMGQNFKKYFEKHSSSFCIKISYPNRIYKSLAKSRPTLLRAFNIVKGGTSLSIPLLFCMSSYYLLLYFFHSSFPLCKPVCNNLS
jgi:hypothetical protein